MSSKMRSGFTFRPVAKGPADTSSGSDSGDSDLLIINSDFRASRIVRPGTKGLFWDVYLLSGT